MSWLTLLAWLIAAPFLILNLILGIELLLGIWPLAGKANASGATPRTTILMPAHNEAAGIGAIIAALAPQLSARVRLLVVADNCSDETAALARQAGAQVLERQDTSLRGKGHALAFGRDWLRSDPPDAVVVLDADCVTEAGAIAALSHAAIETGRPVQGCYLLRSTPDDGPMVQISNFAFLVKNKVRQRGDARLGAPAILGGTGMAFPWALFADAPLATSDLVEDLALGIDFARRGHAPRFLEEAMIWSAPTGTADTLTQRTRWEHGFVGTALNRALPLLLEGLGKGRPALSWLGLHLLVPPLALLVCLTGVALVACTLLTLLGAAGCPALACLSALAIIAILLAINWARSGREAVSGPTLARIPLYLLWKIPVYLKLVRKRESEWVRTKRTGED